MQQTKHTLRVTKGPPSFISSPPTSQPIPVFPSPPPPPLNLHYPTPLLPIPLSSPTSPTPSQTHSKRTPVKRSSQWLYSGEGVVASIKGGHERAVVGVLSLGMGIMVDISCGSMEDFPGGGGSRCEKAILIALSSLVVCHLMCSILMIVWLWVVNRPFTEMCVLEYLGLTCSYLIAYGKGEGRWRTLVCLCEKVVITLELKCKERRGKSER